MISLRKKRLNNTLKGIGLTYEDYQVISVLRYVDGASVYELANKTSYNLKIVEKIIQD